MTKVLQKKRGAFAATRRDRQREKRRFARLRKSIHKEKGESGKVQAGKEKVPHSNQVQRLGKGKR